MKLQELQASEAKKEYEQIFDVLIKDLDNFLEIPIGVNVLIGTRMVKIHEFLALEPGYILDLKRSAGENLMIFLNDIYFAKGEVTVIEDTFGVRITEINDPRKV
jgi:flagellar motor switch protein FliN